MVKLRILESFIDQEKTNVPKKRQAQFLLRLSTLLEEGYTFHTSVIMLLPHHVKKVDEACNQVEILLRNGEGVSAVLQVLGIPKSYLLPIEMAESHGRLNKAVITLYNHISVVERAKASFQRIMMYPMFLFSILALLFIAFRTYFLPNMKSLVASRPHASPNHVLDWTTLLLHLPDFLLGVCVSIMIIFIILRKFVLRKPIRYQIYLLKKIPILSRWMKLTWTRGFAQETGTLLASGLSLQETLIRLTSQSYQPYLKVMSLQVYEFILLGETVEKAVFLTDCFLKEFPAFIAHGEISGHLAKELLIYGELLTEQIELDVMRNLAYIQPILFCVLAICILAAYLSILLPVYGMIDFI